MTVDLDDIAERILAIDHAIGFLARAVRAHLPHALPAAVLLDELDAALEVRILDAEMEETRPPILEGAPLWLGLRELEELEADAVGRREMGDAERAPARTEDVVAHLADGALVMIDGGRPHDDVEAESIGVEIDCLVEVGNCEAD